MPDIQSVPTEQLQSMLQSSSSSNTTQGDIKSVPTEQLQQMLNQSQDNGAVPIPALTMNGDKQDTSGQLTGLPAIGVEVGRGLERGIGQTSADIGYLANVGGVAKNPVGSAIQNFGLELINKSKEIPDTNLPGFVKGVSNFAGELAPMMATFGAGEAMGLAKLGEGGMTLMSQATKSPRIASMLTSMVRPMGQATLMGTVSALDTASTLPETMDFNHKVNEIYNSGKVGFIIGGAGTVIMDKSLDVLRKYGSSAKKSFDIGMYGSPKAAEDAMNLAKKQGSFDRIVVDPSKPYDQRISVKGTMFNDFSPAQREAAHKAMLDEQEAQLVGIRDAHSAASSSISEEMRQVNEQFQMAQAQAKADIEDAYKIKTASGVSNIERNIAKVGIENEAKLDAIETANVQMLNQSVTTFDKFVSSTGNLINGTKDTLYDSVSKTDPASGFSVDGIIARIKSFLNQHEIDLNKVTPTFDTGVPGMAPVPSNRPAVWKAKGRASSGDIPADMKKTVDYLTGENGWLARLEEYKRVNEGKISLDMLKRDASEINAKAVYKDSVTQATDSGLAQLNATVRPNRLVGDIGNTADKGLFIGADSSLLNLKEAAGHDQALSELLKQQQLVRANFVGDQAFTANVAPKAKAILNNKEGYDALRKFEDSLHLAPDSPIRLTNSFQEYSKASEIVAQSRKRIANGLSQAIDNQTLNLKLSLDKLKRGEVEGMRVEKFANKEALIKQQQSMVAAKTADLRKAEEFKKQLQERISLENKDRAEATQQMATLGSWSTAAGKIQRGAVTKTAWSALSLNPSALISGAVGIALTPRTYTSMARGLKSFAQSSAGKTIGGGLQYATKNRMMQRALLGSLIRSQKKH